MMAAAAAIRNLDLGIFLILSPRSILSARHGSLRARILPIRPTGWQGTRPVGSGAKGVQVLVLVADVEVSVASSRLDVLDVRYPFRSGLTVPVITGPTGSCNLRG